MQGLDLYLDSPWLNAAGTLGFAPPARWPIGEKIGAFLTNPVSMSQRSPALERSQVSFPGGVLMHSGLPNPGLSRVLRKYGERWQQSSLPVWVHLIPNNPDEINQMVRRLEGVEGVAAIEIGIPPEIRAKEALAFVEAAYGELPLVVHIPLTWAGEAWLNELPQVGASAVCLAGPRGLLPNGAGRMIGGRLYGPALYPQMLAAVHAMRRIGLPVIAGAGIYRKQDAQTLLDAGAWAIQLDTVLWRGWVD